MTASARLESESKVYHVVTKGMGGQITFEDDDDRWFFTRRMSEYGSDEEAAIYAWCLMTNHVHILLKAEIGNLSRFMQRLLPSYVSMFNKKHGRTGSLFQKGFWSDPVLTDERLLATMRYIHQNPLKPKLAYTCGMYRWSSYREYLGDSTMTDTDFGLAMLGGVQAFECFHEKFDDPKSFLDVDWKRRRLTYDQALRLAHEALGPKSVSMLANLPKRERDDGLRLLKSVGISNRQISAITGIGCNIVNRAR